MRTRVKVATLLTITFLSFAGCSALFEFNAFSSLDVPAAPKLSDYQGTDGLARLEKDLSSAAVVARLKADPTTTKQIEDYLSATYGVTTFGDPATATAEQRTAAALYADLFLKTTSGDRLVNNVVTTIMTQQSFDGDIESILSGVVPADVIHDPVAFEAMLNAFVEARIAYQQIGASLAPPGVPPEGMNMGDIAQKAAVAYLIVAVVSAVESQTPPLSQADAAVQLYYLVNDQPNDVTENGVSVADPFAAQPELKYIFDAAHAPYPS
jgi:hypothetical protein